MCRELYTLRLDNPWMILSCGAEPLFSGPKVLYPISRHGYSIRPGFRLSGKSDAELKRLISISKHPKLDIRLSFRRKKSQITQSKYADILGSVEFTERPEGGDPPGAMRCQLRKIWDFVFSVVKKGNLPPKLYNAPPSFSGVTEISPGEKCLNTTLVLVTCSRAIQCTNHWATERFIKMKEIETLL